MRSGLTSRVLNAGALTLLLFVLRVDLCPAEFSARGLPTVDSPMEKRGLGHSFRPITRREILQAITDDLTDRGILWGRQLHGEDLAVQAVVPRVAVNMKLRVKSIRLDRLRNRIVFEISAQQEPQYLPIAVTAPANREWIASLAAERADTKVSARPPSATSGGKVRSAPSVPQLLVKPGAIATLVMLRPNARVTTFVRALQPGAKGQRILVRDLNSARVMTAEVVDQNLLQKSF